MLRLRGDYLAIVTLGFGEMIRLLLINLNTLTGGPDGISGIPKPSVFGLEMTRRASTEGGTTFHDFFGLTFQNQHMVIYLYMMAPAAGADYVVRVHAPDPHAGRPRLGSAARG